MTSSRVSLIAGVDDRLAQAPRTSPNPATEELHGTFVRLRLIQMADAEMTLRWRQTERAALLNRGAQTVAEQVAWIAARPASEHNFIIELLATDRPVGMLSLTSIDLVHRRAEPGRFLIGEPEAVQGIPVAVEAMKLLYELAFDRLPLIRVYGTVAADNPLMIKWQKYLGMKEEGRLRSHYFLDGRFQDAICLGLLVDEYRAVTLPRMRALIAAARPARARSTAPMEDR
jgi:RimJ/RimL family protein N-acetyltransferase